MSCDDPQDDAILAAFRRSVTAVVPEVATAEVTPDRTLAELGCNSIDRADIVTMTMAELGIVVPVAEFGRDRDVGSLVALLKKYA